MTERQKQALKRAILLMEWEIENPIVQPPPEGWRHELKEDKEELRKMLPQQAIEGFFLSAPSRKDNQRRKYHL